MEEKKICSECGTENEEKFEFCKNCGKELYSEKREAERRAKATPPSRYDHSAPYGFNGNMNIPDIDGISTEEVAAFVGKKAHKIVPKLAKMQVTSSKVSWCWPAAILGYMLGPLGAALWYLYRKMYKVALIFAAVGILLMGVQIAVSYVLPNTSSQSEIGVEDIMGIYEDYIHGEITFDDYMESLTDSMNASSGPLSDISGVATLVIAGLFSYHWYKKQIVKSIMKIRANNTDPRYYHFALTASGGTSAGAVILGIVVYYGVIVGAAMALMFTSGSLF